MATVLEPATYWCHQCLTSVRPNMGNDILCPYCNGGFIEEIENAPAPPQRQRSTVVFGGEPREPRFFTDAEGNQAGRQPPLFHVLQAMSAILQQARQESNNNLTNLNNPGGGGAGGGGGGGYEGEPGGAEGGGGGGGVGLLDPMVFVQNVFGRAGGNLEVYLDTGAGTRRLPANFGDYFFGPGLEQLIQQLAENDPNRYGTPPASKTAIEAMPVVRITSEHMKGGDDVAQCAVCKDEFELGSEVRQMPCKHLYHQDCILPWLQQHNSCPVCRHEMPTDDPDYNTNMQGRSGGARAGAGGSGSGSGGGGGGAAGGGGGGGGGGEGGRGSRGFTIWGAPVGGEAQESGSSRGDEGRNRRVSSFWPWPFRPQQGSQSGGGSSRGPSDSSGRGQGGGERDEAPPPPPPPSSS